jgi:hypothetical protein
MDCLVSAQREEPTAACLVRDRELEHFVVRTAPGSIELEEVNEWSTLQCGDETEEANR